jgi:hypothetical protein
MKVSFVQVLAAGALVAASTQTFADAVVPGGGVVSSYSGTTPAGDTNGGLIFSLFSKNSDTTFSLNNFLGLSLNDVIPTEMDQGGLVLTWHIEGLSNIPTSVLTGDLVWGVSASDNGATTNATAGDIRLVTTVNTGFTGTPTNQGIADATNTWNLTVTPNNNVSNASPVDFTTVALSPTDLLNAFSVNINTPNFSWVGGVGDTLAMYLYTESGARGTAGNPATAALYAGTWAFDLAAGTLTYTVPGVAPVPLPAAAWLLLSGLGGLGFVGRRRGAAPAGGAA